MGQVSSCISSGHAHAHNPPEYSQGLSALEAGRFTYADIYFQHAVEHHPGYSFWEELRAAAFAPPAAAMKEASAARAEPTSPVGADLFLSRSEKDSMAPPSEGGMLSSHSLTTGGRAESGGRHAMLEFSVSEAELRPKMDFLRLVADVAMAYTKVDYEERALYYWHLIAVCSHLLWQLIAHRERCGPMMAPPPPPPPPPPSTGEAGRRAWIHEVAKDERGTLMNPLHYSTRNIDSSYRDGFRTYVDASKEAKLEQLLTSLQQVLCRYCVSALMNYGVILCEQRVYFDAVLRQTVDAVDDGAASGGRPRRGTSKLNGLVIPTDVEMPSEWVEEKVRLVAYRGISATLPPLSTVARISALRRRHIRKMFQVFECTVVVMRQLLMMSCGHCDSVFNTQVKRWIEQATFVDGGSGGGANNNNNNKNNVHDAGNDDDREENAVQLPRSPIGDGPLVEQASGSSLGSSNTQDSFGSSGLFEAGTDGGIAFILQPVTALPLSLVVNMEEVAKGNVSKSVSMAGELPSLHFAAHQPLGEDLPTVYVGHVADFVERMCQRTQIDYPTMMAARMQRQSKDIQQQQQQQVSAERRLSYNVQEAAQAERRADEAAAAAVAQLNAEDDDAGEMAADGTARAQRSADDGAGGEKTAAERYVEYMSKTVGNLKREEEEFRATLLAYQRPSAAVLGKPTPSSSMSAHRDGGPVDPTMLHDGLCDEECVLLMMCLLFLRVKIYIRTDNPYQAFRTLTRIEQQTKEIYGENTVMAKLFLNRCQWLRARASRRAKTLRESKKHREAS